MSTHPGLPPLFPPSGHGPRDRARRVVLVVLLLVALVAFARFVVYVLAPVARGI